MPCTDDASGDTGDRRSSFGCAASATVQPSLSVKTAPSWRGIVPFTHLAREGRMTVTIGRRELLAALGGAVAAWPLAARAQQGDRMRRLGILMVGAESDPQYQADVAVFREGLQKLGWVDGQNIRIEVRWAGFDAETMRRYAKELIALQPDLILSNDTPTTATLLQQTRSVPIV